MSERGTTNYKQIAEKPFTMCPQKVDVIFSTDSYRANSIKGMERTRRGCGERLLVRGENTKSLRTGRHSLVMIKTRNN